MKTTPIVGLAAALSCLASLPVHADDAQIIKRIDEMQKQLENQQQQIETQKKEIERLRSQLGTPTPPVASTAAASDDATKAEVAALKEKVEAAETKAKSQPSLTFNNLRPTVQSADGRNTLSIRSRVQLDAAMYSQDDAGPLAADFRRGSQGSGGREVNSARELSNGANFRRAQLGVEGKFLGDFNYRVFYEVGGSGTEGPARLHEAWITYTGLAPFTVQAGAFAPNADLDDATSSDETLFIERASPAELTRSLAGSDGRYGIGLKANDKRWYMSAYFTGGTLGDAEVADEQTGVVARAAGLPYSDDDVDLHVGASLNWVLEPADQGSLASGARYPVRLRDRPELRVDSTRLIDTGTIDAQSAHAGGLEAAGRVGSVFFQGEYFSYGIERRASSASDPEFSGWYAEASWVLTGEAHRYNSGSAAFSAPKPGAPLGVDGGFGAIELAARYSHVDLNYHEGLAGTAATADAVRGGEQDIWTLGVNWYMTPNLRTTLNYFIVDVDRLNPAGVGNLTPFGASPATPPNGAQIGQDLNAVALRLQFGF